MECIRVAQQRRLDDPSRRAQRTEGRTTDQQDTALEQRRLQISRIEAERSASTWCIVVNKEHPMPIRKSRQCDKKRDPVRVSVTFDCRDYDELQAIAQEKRVSVSWVVRDAVGSYLGERSPLFRRESGGKLSP